METSSRFSTLAEEEARIYNSTPQSRPTDTTNILFHALSTYPFDQDPDFQTGLSSILQSPTPLSSDENLILQAKCFYFAKKHSLPSISPEVYQSWLVSQSQPQPQPPSTPSEPLNPANPPNNSPTIRTQTNDPSYPSNFTHLIDLITSGAPIPGIDEIPPTVLDASTSLSVPEGRARRRKPWESELVRTTMPGEEQKGQGKEGVLEILRGSTLTANAVAGKGQGVLMEEPRLEDATGE